MAQSLRGVIGRRGFLQYVGLFVVAVLFPRKCLPTHALQDAPTSAEQAGVFPFDLAAALLESPAVELNNYDSKILKLFLPFIGR